MMIRNRPLHRPEQAAGKEKLFRSIYQMGAAGSNPEGVRCEANSISQNRVYQAYYPFLWANG